MTGAVLTLCPPPAPFPARAAVRSTRVVVEGDEIVVRRRGGRVLRVPLMTQGLGPREGVVALLGHVDVAAPHAVDGNALALVRYRGYLVPHGRPGEGLTGVDVTGESAQLLAVLPLEHWTPGCQPLPRHRVRAGRVRETSQSDLRDLLDRSGLAAALDRAGVPVHAVGRVSGESYLSWARRQPDRAVVADPDLPRWVIVLRFGLAAAMLAAVVLTAQVPPMVGWAAVLLAVPVLAGAQLAVMAWRDRATRIEPDAQMRPAPTPGVPVTRRFRAKARVAVVGREIVFVDGLGAEQWHPLDGPTALRTCEVVRDRASGGAGAAGPVVAVRFRLADGRVVAVLPAREWSAAGSDGHADWADLDGVVRRAGLRRRDVREPVRRDDGADRYAPLSRAEVVSRLRHRRGMPSLAEDAYAFWIALGVFVLSVGRPEVSWSVTRLLSGLVLAAFVAWYLGPPAVGRLWCDRPGSRENLSQAVRSMANRWRRPSRRVPVRSSGRV